MEEKRDTIEFFENQCCICYATFWQKKTGRMRLTCSNSCRSKLYYLRRKGKMPPEAATSKERQPRSPVLRDEPAAWSRVANFCPVCGEPITQPARGRKRKTCSEKCKKALWRMQNPKCVVCGKHFKLKPHTTEMRYCSTQCREKAKKIRARYDRIARYKAENPVHITWAPKPGSGYREERLAQDGARGEVIRERKVKPRYEEDHDALIAEERKEGRYYGSAEEMRAQREEDAQAARAEREAARKAEERGRQLYREFFEEEWRWHPFEWGKK